MRIVFIATSEVPSRTANSIQVMKVCDAHRSIGHDVKLYVPGPDRRVPWDGLKSHYGISTEFPIEWLRSLKMMKRFDFAATALWKGRRWGADYFYIWTLQAAAIASSFGYPTILEMHDRPPGLTGPSLFKMFLSGKGARRLLPITHSMKRWVDENYDSDFAADFVRVAPMGVDLARYANLPNAEDARKKLGLHEGVTAGYSGHFYAGRGMELLFELAKRNRDVNFLWVGGDPSAVDEWRRKASGQALGNLQIVGFVDNALVPMYQAASDVLLMPYQQRISISSGGDTAKFASPMKVFEYLASGKAIISSDLPVIMEILNQSNAFLLPSDDLDAWDQTLKELVVDDDLRERLGGRAKKDAERFSWSERARMSVEDLPGNGTS